MASTQKQLTGHKVALMFFGFFAVVSAVNVVMVRTAVSTFTGLETKNPYQAGLVYEREIAASAQQNERHWQIEVSLRPEAGGATSISILARDKAGLPISGLDGETRLVHPASAKNDMVVALTEIGGGRYQAKMAGLHGNWNLDLTFARNGERLFRSTSRIALQ